MNIVKIKCDWQSNVCGMDIEDCVVVRPKQSEIDANQLDVMQLITEFDCKGVNFEKPSEKPEQLNDLFININCGPMHVINEIVVCSEARIIELFGKMGEYVSIHQSLGHNDFDGIQMYSHLIPIDTAECALKLKQYNNSNFVWIFGIIIYLTEMKEHPKKFLGPINMQNVENLLVSKPLDLNASNLFSLLSLKQSKSINNDVLMSIFNKMENSKFQNNETENNNFMEISFKQFEKKVEDKLQSMVVQMNTIENNVETLNKKFDLLLSALHDKNTLL